MNYAEVAVNSPVARRHSFCYSVPTHLTVSVGQAVWIPFGSKVLQGIVVKLSTVPSVEVTKEIISIISPRPLLSLAQVKLALWLSEYYLAPLFDAVALMLPPGFERRLVTLLQLSSNYTDSLQLTSEQIQVIKFVEDRGKITLKELGSIFGKKKAEQITGQLIRLHLLIRIEQLQEARVKPKLVQYLKLEIDSGQIATEIDRLKKTRAYKQSAVIGFLASYAQPVSLAELRKSIPCQRSVIESLKDRGLISIIDIQVRRDPLANLKITTTSPPELTPSQKAVWESIRNSLVKKDKSLVFLLAGVTGSGKTEIYLRALAEVVSQVE